jgi:hypothetical protein
MSPYLGIETKEPVAVKLDAHFAKPGFQIESLHDEAWEYLVHLEMDNLAALDARMRDAVSSDESFRFFRSKERLTNTKLIIQYLIKFCEGLPDEADIMDELVNPFDQMREFAAYHIHQLNEDDVVDAILREHQQLGLLKEANRWYYQGQIRKNHKEFLLELEQVILPNQDGYTALFSTLCKVSTFWFSVRREVMSHCRRTDVYIYLFASYLLKTMNPGLSRNRGVS